MLVLSSFVGCYFNFIQRSFIYLWVKVEISDVSPINMVPIRNSLTEWVFSFRKHWRCLGRYLESFGNLTRIFIILQCLEIILVIWRTSIFQVLVINLIMRKFCINKNSVLVFCLVFSYVRTFTWLIINVLERIHVSQVQECEHQKSKSSVILVSPRQSMFGTSLGEK